jgi:4-amino-4-deoxy-L-arabinose transferase-like glycosyltransferase
LTGAAAGVAALIVPGLGLLVALLVAVLLFRGTRSLRATSFGPFMIGIGTVVALLLLPALTNSDPAVRYDPSTVPVMVIGAIVAMTGVGILISAFVHRREPGNCR